MSDIGELLLVVAVWLLFMVIPAMITWPLLVYSWNYWFSA